LLIFCAFGRVEFFVCVLMYVVKSFVVLSDYLADENDVFRVFSFASKAMNVKPLTSAPLIQVLFPAVGSLSAGLQSLPKTQFQLTSSGSELRCSRIFFNYSSSLFCNFSNGTSKSDVAFLPRAAFNDRLAQVMFKGSVRGSCDFYVEGWQFASAGSCQIRVSISGSGYLGADSIFRCCSRASGLRKPDWLPSISSQRSINHLELQCQWYPLLCSAFLQMNFTTRS